jgi:hypothetical protein
MCTFCLRGIKVVDKIGAQGEGIGQTDLPRKAAFFTTVRPFKLRQTCQ